MKQIKHNSFQNSKYSFLKNSLLLLLFIFSFFNGIAQNESIKKIGESSRVSYVMYTDNNGNLYFVNIEDHYLDLMKYDLASDTIIKVSDNFIDDRSSSGSVRNEGFGAIAPTVSGDTVYCMTTAGSGSGYADIFRLICSEDKLEHIVQISGQAYWMIFNLTLSKDGKTLYYISNNASVSRKALYRVDIAAKTCTNVLNLGAVIPERDLCFGGINVWDNFNNFYLPVWKFFSDNNDPESNKLSLLKIHAEPNNYSAELLHFTDNNSVDGTPLFPEFRNHSCWSGIGSSSYGNIYIAASNHYQSSTGAGEHGNVAIYKYEPDNDIMKFLGDIKSVSENVNNWMEGESQHKVHTFLMEHADGKIYFATDDYYPSHFIRGSHLYTIDIETDEIEDYSKTQPYVMKKDFSLVANTEYASETSGVFTEYFGIKGISLNKNAPKILYAMTFSNPGGNDDSGYILKHKIEDGTSSIINNTFDNKQIRAYPNPFTSQVWFDLSKINTDYQTELQILDINGRLLFRQKIINEEQLSWAGKDSNGRDLPQGIYFYKISSVKKGIIWTGKLLKQF